MNTTENLQQLRSLHLLGMANSYQSVLELPINKHPESHDLMGMLIDAEVQHRRQVRTKILLGSAKLRYSASVENISCSAARNLTKQQLAQLASCSYIEQGENILITGATGCGKSYLACALGQQACLMGYKTLYLNMNRFCEKLMLAKIDGTYIKVLNQLEKVRVLILDDFGLQPMDQQVKLALLQILEDRYQNSSIIIASQVPVNKWYEYINEPTLADAILDRIIANNHRIELKGESMRKKINQKSI